MSDIKHGMQPSPGSAVATGGHPRHDWPRAVLITATLIGGIVTGAGGFAYAATATGHVVWQPGHRLQRVQHMVHNALDSVGATTVQEDKVHDIIANGFTSMGGARAERLAMRRQVLDLLRAPTVDRAAVEKLRAEQVAKFDAKSKSMVGMILDSADQLTPDQRSKLADRAEAMMDRDHGGWHRWGGPHGSEDGNGMPSPDGHGQDDGGPRSDGNPG